jgi:hypothetical protein
MKSLLISALFCVSINVTQVFAQEETSGEKYGNTLNAGLGIGYYGYVGHSMPVININYEIGIAKNFTLAPFVTVYSYTSYRYWGNPNYPYRNYSYRQTVIPIGVKGTYYFDQLVHAGSKWDFYLAGSLGFAIRKTTWENEYYGETTVQNSSSGLYLDVHIGAEYHINERLGIYLDLSTGLSSLGLAFHL